MPTRNPGRPRSFERLYTRRAKNGPLVDLVAADQVDPLRLDEIDQEVQLRHGHGRAEQFDRFVTRKKVQQIVCSRAKKWRYTVRSSFYYGNDYVWGNEKLIRN